MDLEHVSFQATSARWTSQHRLCHCSKHPRRRYLHQSCQRRPIHHPLHASHPSGITDHCEQQLIAPAVKGTTSTLDAAYTSPEIKRIIITSSIVATVSVNAFLGLSDEIFEGQKKVHL